LAFFIFEDLTFFEYAYGPIRSFNFSGPGKPGPKVMNVMENSGCNDAI